MNIVFLPTADRIPTERGWNDEESYDLSTIMRFFTAYRNDINQKLKY